MRRAAALCGFLSVIVYPAIPLGRSSGVPIIEVFGLIVLAVALRRGATARGLAPLALLLLPLWVSGMAATLGGGAVDASVVAKSVVTMALALSCLAIPALLEDRSTFLAFLDGLSLGIGVHVAFGLIQLGDFSRGSLSYLWLYETNPGLPFSRAIAADFVLYIKRPWGLFPEPSAMAASLGPLLVPLIEAGLSRESGRARRALYLASSVCGVALVIASRSGFSVFLTAAVGALLVARLFRGRARRTSLLALGGAALLAVGGVLLVWLAVSVLGDRTQLSRNDSWQIRWASLGASISILTASPAALLFGAGPGQSFLWLMRSGVAAATGITAIWSVVLTYVAETGVLGLVALGLVFAKGPRALRRSGRPFAGAVMWGAWLVAVCFTTSYPNLPPLWISLGMLLAWDRLFVRASARPTPWPRVDASAAALHTTAAVTRPGSPRSCR